MQKEINLLDIAKLILKQKKTIIYVCAAFFILISIYHVFATRLYKSELTFMPLEASNKGLAGSFGGSGAAQLFAGFVGDIVSKTSSDRFQNILKSRTLTENIIKELNLLPEIHPKKWDSKRKRWKKPNKEHEYLASAVKYMQKKVVRLKETSKDLMIIWIIYKDRKKAQIIATEYINQLQKFINQNTFSLSKKNRIFLEKQLELKKIELAKAEEKLKDFQEKHNIVSINTQAEMTVRTTANLKAEILSREYQLAMLRKTSGLRTRQAQKILDEIKELKKQLNLIESDELPKDKKIRSGAQFTPIGELSKLKVDYFRLKRDALILEKVFELLTQQ